MDLFPIVGGLAGGVGLFLLGMAMMTDGLKLAAGPALENILARWTKTRLLGLASGVLVTALVQSSSAVTVAAIGFVNAGLLDLSQALWVLFGANIGTTITGWLVALVGLKIKVELLALPMIGAGMLLRLTGEGSRRSALGTALAGFGVLFVGIDMLRETFSGLAASFELPRVEGMAGIVVMVAVGVAMTVLMQASAASLVLAFSAAQSGMVSLEAGAAIVIGANIGTTVTALLATIGATPNARCAAGAHIAFNLLTGAVALIILPWLLAAIGTMLDLSGGDTGVVARLALFHTVFNVLGVILIWPLAGHLTRFLQWLFHRAGEDDEVRPLYLDKTVLAVPALALEALEREVRHMGSVALASMQAAFTAAENHHQALVRQRHAVSRLNQIIADFIVQLSRANMSAESAKRLPKILRIARYYEAATELAAEAAEAAGEGATVLVEAVEVKLRQLLREQTDALLHRADPLQPASADELEQGLHEFEISYHMLKVELLEAGAEGRLPVGSMDSRLRAASALRRAMQQAVKAAHMLGTLRSSQPEEIATVQP